VSGARGVAVVEADVGIRGERIGQHFLVAQLEREGHGQVEPLQSRIEVAGLEGVEATRARS
jgi:hypothetical protein